MSDKTAEKAARQMDKLKESIIEELEKVLDKLPWWKQAIIWAGGILALIAGIAACAAISSATGPAYAVAVAVCIAAILGLIITIIIGAIEYAGASSESDKIDTKKARLKELKDLLEEAKEGAPEAG